MEKNKYIKYTYILVALFFILNIITVLKYKNYLFLESDDFGYLNSATTLLKYHRFTYHFYDKSTAFIMPGITFLIAPFYIILKTRMASIMGFRLLQVLIQCCSLYIIILICNKIFKKRTALITGILCISYIPEYFVTGLVLTEVTFKFLFILLVYISILALESKKTKYYILGGIVWGLACMFKATAALYPLSILIAWIFEKYSVKDMFKYAIITTTVFCIIMSPWWIRNALTFHRFIPLSESSGDPMLLGTYIGFPYKSNTDDNYINLLTKYDDNDFKDEIKMNKLEKDYAVERLKNNFPKNKIKYIKWYGIDKAYYLWAYPFYWKSIYRIKTSGYFYVHKILMIVSILGLLLSIKNKERKSYFIFNVIACYTICYIPFFCFSRYNYPAMWLTFIYTAYFIDKIIYSKIKPLN